MSFNFSDLPGHSFVSDSSLVLMHRQIFLSLSMMH